MTKFKQTRLVKASTIVFAMLLAIILLIVPTALKASALDGNKFHGIDITGVENLEAYSLDIKLSSNEIYFDKTDIKSVLEQKSGTISGKVVDWLTDIDVPAPHLIKRMDADVQLLFYFPDVKINNQSVYFSTTQTVNLPYKTAFNMFNRYVKAVIQNTEFSISLTNNYYNEFSNLSMADFKNYSVILVWRGNGYRMCANNSSSTLFTGATTRLNATGVPVDVLDPNSPNYDPNFGNNGDNTAPDISVPPTDNPTEGKNTETNNAFDWLAGIFGTTSENIKAIIVIIGVVLAIAFAIKIFK